MTAGFAVLFVGAAPAYADVQMFLCSASIVGESNDVDSSGCNQLLAVGESIELLAHGADKPANAIDVLPVELRKPFDLGSPSLSRLAVTEQPFDGVVSFHRSGDVPFVFLEITLQNARVVKIELGEDAGLPAGTLTILPERIGWTCTKQNNHGTAGEQINFFFDVKSGMSS